MTDETASHTLDERYLIEVVTERDGEAFVRRLLRDVVEVAIETHIWVRGDGQGGAIHQWLHDIAAESGHTHTAVPYWPSKQPSTATGALRKAVFERDAYRCLHCGTWIDLTIDHIHPRIRGGTDAFTNLQTLCRSCNSSKGKRVDGEQ